MTIDQLATDYATQLFDAKDPMALAAIIAGAINALNLPLSDRERLLALIVAKYKAKSGGADFGRRQDSSNSASISLFALLAARVGVTAKTK